MSAMASLGLPLLVTLILATSCHSWSPYHDSHMLVNRSVIVQMFEWRHDDIAEECETYLGPYGFGAVQVSPVGEHVVISSKTGGINQPWYQRYQTVSYRLGSRSGDIESLKDMIERCNNAGVRVYIDVVINHMSAGGSGIGSAGSRWNGDNFDYPAVPFDRSHFNSKEHCGTASGGIEDWNNPWQSRNCELVGLHDLNQNLSYVEDKQVNFFNSMIQLGVAGFRVDASKHMYMETMKSTFDKLDNLRPSFGFGARPFMYHEVAMGGGEEIGIKVKEYFPVGKILNFKFMHNMRDILWKRNGNLLRFLKNYGEPWGMMPSEDNVPIVDNHDLQRSFSYPGIRQGCSFRTPRQMKMANAFMLAWPYGTPKVMSSYYWPPKLTANKMDDENVWMGPPHEDSDNYVIKRVTKNPDMSCSGGWQCEQRWQAIRGMVNFRKVVGDKNSSPVTAWWDNGYNAIAFARQGKGWIVINNEDYTIKARLQTTLPPGTYCDVITGELKDKDCTGRKLLVEQDGTTQIDFENSENSVMAIHIEARL